MDRAMPRTNSWSRSVPWTELDERSREACLRLEQIERLLVRTARHSDDFQEFGSRFQSTENGAVDARREA